MTVHCYIFARKVLFSVDSAHNHPCNAIEIGCLRGKASHSPFVEQRILSLMKAGATNRTILTKLTGDLKNRQTQWSGEDYLRLSLTSQDLRNLRKRKAMELKFVDDSSHEVADCGSSSLDKTELKRLERTEVFNDEDIRDVKIRQARLKLKDATNSMHRLVESCVDELTDHDS